MSFTLPGLGPVARRFAPVPTSEGLLIDLEGLDGAGKATQLRLLDDWLVEHTDRFVGSLSLPAYNTESGRLIRQFQSGQLGQLDPYSIASLYAVNRLHERAYLAEWLDKGAIVIADRYVTSNFAYQTARFDNLMDKLKFQLWLHQLEYEVNAMPPPDLVIFLNTPLGASRERTRARGGADINERDPTLQAKALEEYAYMSKTRTPENWLWVETGQLEPEAVHERVIAQLAAHPVFQPFLRQP